MKTVVLGFWHSINTNPQINRWKFSTWWKNTNHQLQPRHSHCQLREKAIYKVQLDFFFSNLLISPPAGSPSIFCSTAGNTAETWTPCFFFLHFKSYVDCPSPDAVFFGCLVSLWHPLFSVSLQLEILPSFYLAFRPCNHKLQRKWWWSRAAAFRSSF